MQKDFYIFRHGETDFNKERRWQGQNFDIELNETGLKQAEDACESLKNFSLEAVFASPLKRAHKTAEIASKKLGIPLFINHELKETCFGVMEGKTYDEAMAHHEYDCQKWFSDDKEHWHHKFEGGETKSQSAERFFTVMEDILNEKYSRVGICAHGSIMRNLLAKFGIIVSKIPNTAIYHIRYDNGEWKVL